MADGNFTLKFDVEPNKGSVQQTSNTLQNILNTALERVTAPKGLGNSIRNEVTAAMKSALSSAFGSSSTTKIVAATKNMATEMEATWNSMVGEGKWDAGVTEDMLAHIEQVKTAFDDLRQQTWIDPNTQLPALDEAYTKLSAFVQLVSECRDHFALVNGIMDEAVAKFNAMSESAPTAMEEVTERTSELPTLLNEALQELTQLTDLGDITQVISDYIAGALEEAFHLEEGTVDIDDARDIINEAFDTIAADVREGFQAVGRDDYSTVLSPAMKSLTELQGKFSSIFTDLSASYNERGTLLPPDPTSAIEGFKRFMTTLDEYSAKLDEIKGKVPEVVAQTKQVTTAVSAIPKESYTLDTPLEGVGQQMTEFLPKITDIGVAFHGVQQIVSELPTEITNVETGLSQAATSVQEIMAQIGLQENVGEQGALAGFGSQGFIPTEALEEMENAFNGVQQSVSSLPTEISQVETNLLPIAPSVQRMREEAAEAAEKFERLKGAVKAGIAQPFRDMASALRHAADGMGALLTKVHAVNSAVGGKLKQGVSLLTNKFTQMGKQAGNSIDGFNKRLKRTTLQMVKAMIGVRGLYMLFRKLKAAIQEGMQTMAKSVPEFNAVFSDFKTALNQTKGSIATAFQPIAQVVLPILTNLIGMLNTVIEAIARFNAVLTGQGYIYKFTAAQQDYAKSLKGTGGAAKKATKDLMGFDEINRLSDKNSGGGGGDGGIGDYEKTAVDPTSAISEFAEKVKQAWKNADFTEVGQIIGNKLKEGFTKATEFFSTTGQEWAHKLASSLSTLINGLVSVEGLGESFGTALASALNTGITFMSEFFNGTNWRGLGDQIGGAINGLFLNIDWEGIGTWFSGAFNGLFDFIGGIGETVDWTGIGTRISDGFDTMISGLDTQGAAESLSSIIVGLFNSAVAFLTNTDFEEVGGKIADFFTGIDWSGILGGAGSLLSKGAQGILDMVIGFCKKTDWAKLTTDILDGIGQMFENVWDDGQLLQKLADGFVQLFIGAFKILWNIGGWISDNVVDPMIDSLVNLFEQQDTGSLGENIIMGLLDGITNALTGIGTWLYDNLFLPIWNGIKDCFDIHSPSGKMMEIGLELVAGLLLGLQNLWEDIKQVFTDTLESIKSWGQDVVDGVKEKMESVKEGIQEKWDSIKDWLTSKAENIKSSVLGKFNALKDKVVSAMQLLRDSVKLIWEGLWNGIKKVINWIIGGINSMISGVCSGINKLVDILNALSFTVPDWIPELGGKEFGFNLSYVTAPQIPLLAQGAVLPPNNPFLAMVGDQPRGTNVEAPLDTIKQAVAEVLAENNDLLVAGFEAVVNAIEQKDTNVYMDGKKISENVNSYNNRQARIRGYAT